MSDAPKSWPERIGLSEEWLVRIRRTSTTTRRFTSVVSLRRFLRRADDDENIEILQIEGRAVGRWVNTDESRLPAGDEWWRTSGGDDDGS